MELERKYRILFVFNHLNKQFEEIFPEICNGLIKIGHDVHVIYSPQNISEEFEIKLRKVPWINAKKLLIANGFDTSWADIPFAIRRYIKKHNGMDVIHSFGLCCGVLSYPAGVASQAAIINTPDAVVSVVAKNTSSILKRFINDNISYVFNRLCDLILFSSQVDKTNSADDISYRKVASDFIDFAENGDEVSKKLLEIYENAIATKRK